MLLKLQHPNCILEKMLPPDEWPADYVEYIPKRKTAVISKQSILFNQYTSLAALKIKMGCSQHDVLYWIAMMRQCETSAQWANMKSAEMTWLPLGKIAGLSSAELRKLAGCYWLDGKGREWKPPTTKKSGGTPNLELFPTAYEDLIGGAAEPIEEVEVEIEEEIDDDDEIHDDSNDETEDEL